jgi:hypothetical protein
LEKRFQVKTCPAGTVSLIAPGHPHLIRIAVFPEGLANALYGQQL